ncbi:TolC family protein [Herbaspirillum sp.]|jgi:cobalt-zinc-cadmium efflux system outer membrane protein|uniref:TolC family protein n=1 Tax=Herbaspirillum TaxID=963 RepID=UPI0025899F8F|nr:TolC family protein [Herbaspirillum sp.]MCP3657989.1 TolC family protein [Herbaspirillum sp.]MCP3946519.1 TolC family protein [Herbaspirillum sp.]MCP4029727.1 TolC family protein [Herbaspirillum sp.]MCP4554023.1 TolC family protein [Herbaspirillum sp.]
MFRHSFMLGLALLAASSSHAQSPAQSNPQSILPATASALDREAGPLSLQAAISLAFDHNKTLAAARKEIEAVEATILQAGARPNPEFSALIEDVRKSSRTTTYQINQAIELGGKRGARIEAAQRARDMAVLEYAAKRSELRAAVVAAYVDVMVATERQRLAGELLGLAKTSAEMTGRRVTAGKISPVEQTKAQVAQSGAQLELSQANSELLLARRTLAMLWGGGNDRVQLSEGGVESLPPLPAIAQLTEQVANGPAVRLARLEVERRRALARIETSKRTPDVSLTLGNKRDESSARNMWVVGFSVPIPVFDSNQGNELEALKRVDIARDTLAVAEVQMQGEAAQGFERLRNAREEATALRNDIVPAAQSAYQAARTGFEAGKFAYLDVLDAQRTYFQAKAQYWKALSTAFQAAADLDRLAGIETLPAE